MVYIKDEGGTFDASLDVIWKYLQAVDKHGLTHHGPYTQKKPLSESAMEFSWENKVKGKTVNVKTRVTTLMPLGVAIEIMEGPMAGSKFINLYTPKGDKTEITVIGEFNSDTIPPGEIERNARRFLELIHKEDIAAIKSLTDKK
jgi:hypothetical protein